MPRRLAPAEIDAFRDDLCGVATRLFAERGVEGVTLRALARELGCSPMTPYRYFRNKEEIFLAVRCQAFRRFGARVERAARRRRDPVERLRGLCAAYVRFALDEPHAYRIMFQLDQPEGPPPPELEEVTYASWLPLLRTLEEAVEGGRLLGNPTTLAHLCWVQVHGAVTLHLAGKLILGRRLEDLVSPLVEIFLAGCGARPQRAPPCPDASRP